MSELEKIPPKKSRRKIRTPEEREKQAAELDRMAEKQLQIRNGGGRKTGLGSGTYALDVEEGDNTKFVTLGMKIAFLPNVDLSDPEAVSERLQYFFQVYAEADVKPPVAGMALSLGISRQELYGIVRDKPMNGNGRLSSITGAVADLIKKAYAILEQSWEEYMAAGKVNPVVGIFMSKNHYGYTDQQEVVVTPNTRTETDYNAEDIAKRYLPKPMDDASQP